MSNSFPIVCDDAELAVECARLAEELSLEVVPTISPHAISEALTRVREGHVALALSSEPPAEALVQLAESAAKGGSRVVVAILSRSEEAATLRELARDLGLVAVTEARPLVSAIALVRSGAERPWAASLRHLPPLDRERFRVGEPTSEREGALTREHAGRIGFTREHAAVSLLGEPRDVAEALFALREASGVEHPAMPRVEGVEAQAVLDVIFGPPRALSDPASKAALESYDVPLPIEELCTSASRAAAEATRIGYPVRIALASPDLRVGDHPDLSVDGVDNAARVRDIFRQLVAAARSRAPEARILGVTISATTPAHALLRIALRTVGSRRVLCEIGFADAHGRASGDRTATVLPATSAHLERVLGRLRGSALLLDGNAADRRRTVSEIGDVLLRLAAFAHDFRSQVDSITIDPLAILVGGGVEIREACVVVGDSFERSLNGVVPSSVGG